ncbi:MAG: chemotaxis protein CheA [Firmicutes bacterium]|nr:chemotaxis protein CheA [Bacillota bacterium]
MDISSFREVFAAEARDYLQSLNEDLLRFERNPGDKDTVDDMFRAAHSLKGMAGTMGFDVLAEFTHEMESVLDLLRNHELEPTLEVINALFGAVDTLEVLLEQTISDAPITPVKDQIAVLEALTQNPDAARKDPTLSEEETEDEEVSSPVVQLDVFNRETIKQGVSQGHSAFFVKIRLRANTILKSVRVYTVFQAIEQVATVIQSNPSVQELEEEKFEDSFILTILTKESQERISEIIRNISEIDSVEVTELSRVEQQQLRPDEEVAATAERVEAVKQTQGQASSKTVTPVNKQQRREALVRVETDRLDKLINLVGELVTSRTQVIEMAKGDDSIGALDQLDRVTTELQYAAMSLRMVAIKQVFDRFPRMVRDLAQASGKDIDLRIFGEMTELDRSIVNQIGDPLVHLIRNSIDHGLESAADRIAKGKPKTGTITLGARHEGSHILIEISDDGQGINLERIRTKAIERGLISLQHGELSVSEAGELLFSPGFSTAQEITDLSGRGVGLDAVRSVVHSLSGTIEIESEPDQFMRTIIKLPLTLAIIKALLVVADGETLAIPIQAVRENIQVERDQIKTVQQHDVIMLRDEVLPLYDLAECLGFKPLKIDGPLPVIVVEIRGQKVGFVVEDLIGQQEIVIKSIKGTLSDIRGIAGATVLGNGNIALIIDNSTLIG